MAPEHVTMSHRGRGRKTALLLIDWINDFAFPGHEGLLAAAKVAAQPTAALAERARGAGVPVIYVNDNFGAWRSSFSDVIDRCQRGPGHEIVELLHPRDDDFFVLKPKHSGFLHTPLELLLDQLECGRLVVTGLAGNICVLFTAHDAHMRDFRVAAARDCTASNTKRDNDFALDQLAVVIHAELELAAAIDLGAEADADRSAGG
jgi:nicotinamidase-related amidase